MPLFVHNLFLFITKAPDALFIYPIFNDKCKEIAIFNQLIEALKLSK
jgi:hypothetical protein